MWRARSTASTARYYLLIRGPEEGVPPPPQDLVDRARMVPLPEVLGTVLEFSFRRKFLRIQFLKLQGADFVKIIAEQFRL